MKITLHNFRCHVDSTFDIPDTGLVSLSGESGAGKSTILTALCYAFYGKINGKVKKPYTHGKKTSTVIVEINGSTITRSSHPNRLLVEYDGVEYEDETAQSVIDQNITGLTYNEFLASSYIIQNQEVSVLTMTPANQLEFVQKLAFLTNANEVAHQQIRETLTNLKNEKSSIEAQVALLEQQHNTLMENTVEPEVPAFIREGGNIKQLKKDIENITKDIEAVTKRITSNSQKLDAARAYEKERSTLLSEIDKMKMGIDASQERLEILEEQLKKENPEQLNAELKRMTALQSAQQKRQKYEDERAKFVALQSDHTAEVSGKMERLRKEILSQDEYNTEVQRARKLHIALDIAKENRKREIKITEANTAINSVLSWMMLWCDAPLNNTQEMLDALDEKRAEILATNGVGSNTSASVLSCPCCTAGLIYYKNKLYTMKTSSSEDDGTVVVPDTVLQQIDENTEILRNSIALIKMCTPSGDAFVEVDDIETLERDIEKVTNFLVKSDNAKEELRHLENSSSSVLDTLAVKLKKMETELGITTECNDGDNTKGYTAEDISALQVRIATATSNKQQYDAHVKDIEKKKKKLAAAESSISTETTTNVSELEKKSRQYTRDLSTFTQLLAEKRNILDSLNEYENYTKAMVQIQTIFEDIATRNTTLEEINASMEGYMGLERACKEAEILALDSTVSSINEHARVYLDKMFTDPITVKLDTVKDTKNVSKLQLNTRIEYQGDVYDNIDELSGGERQRCELAFLLAVNDMLGSRILLLDECLNNLDSTINTEVLTFLRDLTGSSEKLILVVSHEAVTGVFDNEVIVSH